MEEQSTRDISETVTVMQESMENFKTLLPAIEEARTAKSIKGTRSDKKQDRQDQKRKAMLREGKLTIQEWKGELHSLEARYKTSKVVTLALGALAPATIALFGDATMAALPSTVAVILASISAGLQWSERISQLRRQISTGEATILRLEYDSNYSMSAYVQAMATLLDATPAQQSTATEQKEKANHD
jgi:cell wall-associated NlpC family hydrolase